ncbi:hypothetical protein HOF40_02730 [Candidatus Parcubacteria bacterium]|jgi:tetratricopeptide (TPR) repeat protein|nr:hypothetical protein [Candidatus Parcubacteria bacterium]MBT3948980.1 hypothetical protein [Candidatus Parcubacteria bacterium]
MKKNFIFGLVSLLVVILMFAFVYFLFFKDSVNDSVETSALITEFDQLVQDNPELQSFVDEIEKWESKQAEDPERVETFNTLGMAWKSLGDRTKDDRHYERALEVYKEGIERTDGKNTLFLKNAAAMSKYLKRYEDVEGFYLSAIEVAPGEQATYIELAELYEYQLKKNSEEIISLLDSGIERAVISSIIQSHKQRYLNRSQNNN